MLTCFRVIPSFPTLLLSLIISAESLVCGEPCHNINRCKGAVVGARRRRHACDIATLRSPLAEVSDHDPPPTAPRLTKELIMERSCRPKFMAHKTILRRLPMTANLRILYCVCDPRPLPHASLTLVWTCMPCAKPFFLFLQRWQTHPSLGPLVRAKKATSHRAILRTIIAGAPRSCISRTLLF